MITIIFLFNEKFVKIITFYGNTVKIHFVTFVLKVRRDTFLAVCPNKVKGASTVYLTWNYCESAGSAVAAALEAEVRHIEMTRTYLIHSLMINIVYQRCMDFNDLY